MRENDTNATDETNADDRTQANETTAGDEAATADDRGATPSRRTVLQGVAAGTAAGFTGLAGAQDTTTQEGDGTGDGDGETTTPADGQAGFFADGAEVGTQVVADGALTAPTDFAVADEDRDRQFVTDQTGEVYVITPDGLRDEPFINVSDRMVELGRFYGLYADPQQGYDERGLLGIDFHPDFAENRRFYLHYSAPPTDELRSINWDHVEVVSEFRASEDGETADPESERELLRIPSPQYNHDAGPMAFGPDGYLYVPMGDGGGANDDMYGHVPDWYARNTGGNGQDVVHNLMGDILRIDVDSEGEDAPYGIPDDNPFAGEDSAGRDEIYAYGFRNPFGISFDSEGNLFVADAGQNLWEEADVVERGGNYGWNVKEGTHCFSTEQPSDVSAITDCPEQEPGEDPYDGSPLRDPIVEFPHEYRDSWVGITIVGGHRYEQPTIPALEGKYVYGVWTEDPTRQEPAGRVLAATPPEGFDEGDGTQTTAEGDAATTTAEDGTATTPADGETTAADGDGEQVVPRDELWEMEEVVVTGEFDWFVRMFGRGRDGEIYVLVNRRGIPEGDTGAVLQLVPPGEGDDAETTQADGETTTEDEGTTTIGKAPAGTETPGAEPTTTEDETTTAEDEDTTTENGTDAGDGTTTAEGATTTVDTEETTTAAEDR